MGNSVVVLGITGMLGHKLTEVLARGGFRVFGTTRSASLGSLARIPNLTVIPKIDVENTAEIERLIQEVRPQAIINCIGLIKQLPDAVKGVPSIRINSLFPHQLSEFAQTYDSQLIHFSTDCVYSGTKGFYSESDPTDPQDLYGKSKALGEVSAPRCLTLRSSIIGPEMSGRNGLFEWFFSQKGGKVQGYANVRYSGLSTLEMSKLVLFLLQKHPNLSGIYNVASNPISKLEILRLINDKLNLKTTIVENTDVVLDRTLNGEKFNKAVGYAPPAWPQMIDEMVSDPEIQGRLEWTLSL